MMRIGSGFDVHPFVEGKPLVLGGVTIPHPQGMAAHTDGDVVLHALGDAILGALALGDLGHYFKAHDTSLNNADSRHLLASIIQKMKAQHFRVGNVDITIIAEQPKIKPHVLPMRDIIAADLNVERDAISVKATTTDHLGFIGRGEGIAVHAIVLLEKIGQNAL